MHVTIAGLCFTDAVGMTFSHDWRFVVLSYLIAVAGSYAALDLAERLQRADGAPSGWWQMGAAATLGGSIWSMHLLAMLALRIDLPLSFAADGTVLSFLIAVGGAAGGLTLARRGELSWLRLMSAASVIGTAIALMHYVGMGALLFPGTIAYTPGLWATSVVIAIGASAAALWLALRLRPDWRLRVAAALVMGVAICGMHFTGMTSTVFQGNGSRLFDSGLATGPLATAVAGVTLALLGVALMAAAADRRLAVETARAAAACEQSASQIAATHEARALLDQNIVRSRHTAEREQAIQGLLATVFLRVNTPVAIIVTEGRYLMTNPSFDRLLGSRPGGLVGTMATDTIIRSDRGRVLRAAAQQNDDGASFSMGLRLACLDGRTVDTSLTSFVPSQPDLRRFRIVTLARPDCDDGLASPIVAGRIRLISLEEVKAIVGDGWAALESRVMQAAEAVARTHLGAGDTLRTTADHGFIITFAKLSEAEATVLADKIAQDIRRSLIGAGEDPPTVEVFSAATTVSSAHGELAVVSRFAEIYQRSPVLRTPVMIEGCSFELVQGCQRGQFVGYFVACTGGAGGVPGLAPRPIDTQAKIIKAMTKQQQQSASVQSPGLLYVSLPFAAFTARTDADALVQGFKQLDPQIAARVAVLVGDMPAGVPHSRVQDLVMRLQPVCHSIGFSLPDLDPPSFDIGQFKSPLVVIDAAGWGASLPETRVAKLALALHLKRGRLLVRRIESMSAARQLQTAGVDLVSVLPDTAEFAVAV